MGGRVKLCFSLIIVQCVYFLVLCVLRLETPTADFSHLFNYFASGKEFFPQNQPTREFVAISKHNNQDANHHELFTTVISPPPSFFFQPSFLCILKIWLKPSWIPCLFLFCRLLSGFSTIKNHLAIWVLKNSHEKRFV